MQATNLNKENAITLEKVLKTMKEQNKSIEYQIFSQELFKPKKDCLFKEKCKQRR